MPFSKEDKLAWNDSEIMQELEKIALETDIFDPPKDALSPIKPQGEDEDEAWEDEIDKLDKANVIADPLEDSEKPKESEEDPENVHDEFLQAHTSLLLSNLEKLAYNLSGSDDIKSAYRVERAIQNVKALLRGGVNA